MFEIQTEITVESPLERIWQLLSDVLLYPEWNPLFKKVAGTLSIGEELEVVVNLPSMSPLIITPKVVMLEPFYGFSWEHKLFFAWLFNWRYCVEVKPITSSHLKFIQKSEFSGIIGFLFNFVMRRSLADGLAKMNGAIRRWGEKGNIQCLRC